LDLKETTTSISVHPKKSGKKTKRVREKVTPGMGPRGGSYPHPSLPTTLETDAKK